MKLTYYILPDGVTSTRNLKAYVRAWRKLARPIEKLFKVKLSGFDPGFSFVQKLKLRKGFMFQSVQLPKWFVKSLQKDKNE
jgi:hypothetical protein